ncbi:hypothetical protein BDR07DRAFT_1381061 [Suillus spraguei]|nr:hypothetical protein BDR07DRAFT_1381061 [Suillus spraguei]
MAESSKYWKQYHSTVLPCPLLNLLCLMENSPTLMDNKPHDWQAAQKHERGRSHQDAIKYHSSKQQDCRNGSKVPEAQSNSITELHCLLDDMASTPNFELGESADNIGDYLVIKAMIIEPKYQKMKRFLWGRHGMMITIGLVKLLLELAVTESILKIKP